MSLLSTFKNGRRSLEELLRTHRVLVIILLGLLVAAVSPRFLQGQLFGQLGSSSSSSSSFRASDDLRNCSSSGTIFRFDESVPKVRALYLARMNGIFSEHEKILRTPSQWKCGSGPGGEPPMQELEDLAEELPGWHVRTVVDQPGVPLPVTFDAFSAIAAELQREYECKLIELQDRAAALVSRNEDLNDGSFCCSQVGCVPDNGQYECTGALTASPQCDAECPVFLTTPALATRLPQFDAEAGLERQRSRNALERALAAIRSAEVNYAVARQLLCYERASLDLRSELGLVADAVSCMPKIWDAVTSIHDRKE